MFQLTKIRMDEGVKTFRQTPGAVLLDVREPDEYAGGHVPGSVNLPLGQIAGITARVPGLDTPLFVHCRSGARSSRAVAELRRMGYRNAVNIGGMLDYHGEVEQG